MTDEELDKIESRANAARQGPWRSFVEGRDHTSGSNFIMVGQMRGSEREDDIEFCGRGIPIADQDFIAQARQDIPALIAEVRRLKDMIAKY